MKLDIKTGKAGATVKLEPVGDYKSKNFGSNFMKATIDTLSIWFSYGTPIAFENGKGLVVSENCWCVTTGKHLNWVSTDKKIRLKRDEFMMKLGDACRVNGVAL